MTVTILMEDRAFSVIPTYSPLVKVSGTRPLPGRSVFAGSIRLTSISTIMRRRRFVVWSGRTGHGIYVFTR